MVASPSSHPSHSFQLSRVPSPTRWTGGIRPPSRPPGPPGPSSKRRWGSLRDYSNPNCQQSPDGVPVPKLSEGRQIGACAPVTSHHIHENWMGRVTATLIPQGSAPSKVLRVQTLVLEGSTPSKEGPRILRVVNCGKEPLVSHGGRWWPFAHTDFR